MKREYKWELLRAISCVSVLLLHVAALYTEDSLVYNNYSNLSFTFCDFLQIFTRTAVPCFVMLSGAFLLDKKQLDIVKFYKQSVRKLVMPTMFFSIGYMCIYLCLGDKPSVLLINFLEGKPVGHLWFMFMMFGLYGIYPLLYFFKQNVTQKSFDVFAIIMIVLSCLVHFSCKLIWPIQFIEYLGYFLIGYCIRNRTKQLYGSCLFWFLISFLALLITFILNEYQFYHGSYDAAFFRNPNFPSVIIASSSIFIAFDKVEVVRESAFIKEIANRSMIIYMFHPMIINVICKLVKILNGQLPTPFIYVPFLFVLCFFISYIFSSFLDHIILKLIDIILLVLKKRK